MSSRSQNRRASHAHHHAVQFYGRDEDLFVTVAGFLSEGLIAGQPAVVIATEAHREAIADYLGERLIDVAQARHIGDLVVLDAEDVLATFMSPAGVPDADSFSRNVGRVILDARGPRPRTMVRAYGEMVDVLWKQKKPDAALQVERLWNRLATSHSFALLCGYSKSNFFRKSAQYEQICAEHTHVVSRDTNVLAFNGRSRRRTP